MSLMKKVILVTLAVVSIAIAAILWRIGPGNVVGMLRYDQRREGDLLVGHLAPDVSLVALDGRTRVRLGESIGGKPLVIIFGSYT